MPPWVPTQSRPADYSGRWSNHHNRRWRYYDGRRLYDHPPVKITTTIRATMCALAATFRGLGTESCEAQQGSACRYRQEFDHLLGCPHF